MKGTYVKQYKRSPAQVRSVQCDTWHCSELLFPVGFASQCGGSPRGVSIRFANMHDGKGANQLSWYST